MQVGDYLDGEIYNPRLNLQEIVSLLKNNSTNNGRDKLQYWIYDIITADTYAERLSILRNIEESNSLNIVETIKVNSKDYHVERGKEGIMIRNIVTYKSIKNSKQKSF